MKDEEMAEEYRKDLKSKFFLSEPQLDLACQGYKDGFLAGLKAGSQLEKELAKAKDLIRRLIIIYCDQIEYDEFGNTLEEARQFLREIKEWVIKVFW